MQACTQSHFGDLAIQRFGGCVCVCVLVFVG
jgi:hypothetical protein